tara:strand:- start:10140 stop:11279 length:1140 start_codon:yes stop_codon:yes gene_type:complete
VFLQRTPLVRIVDDFQFLSAPRAAHLIKWIAGAAITTGVYNTVTGATGDLSVLPNTNNQGFIVSVAGAQLNAVIRAERAIPATVELTGDLPPGMVTNVTPEGQVPEVPVPGIITFTGVPDTSGEFPMNLKILTWENESTYQGPPIELQFAFRITDEPPEISSQPQSLVVPWGATAELSVEVFNPGGTTYQWQRNVGANLNVFADIMGATDSTYSVPNATPVLDGAYRVQATKNELIETSDVVFISVQVSDYDNWRQSEFDYPESEDAAEDGNPDGDAFINAFEFYFDFNPKRPDSVQSPMITPENIAGVPYVVFTYPPVVGGPFLSFGFETTFDFVNGPWTEAVDGVDGIIIENTVQASVIKMPYSASVYCRMRVDTGD